MEIIFIEDRLEDKAKILPLLKEKFANEIISISSMEEGIETLEKTEEQVKIIICDYHGTGTALIQCLLTVKPNAAYIFITDSTKTFDPILKKFSKTSIALVERSKMKVEFLKKLEGLESKGAMKPIKIGDSEFIRMNITSFRLLSPLESDVYIRLGENKYVKVFHSDDQYIESDLTRYLSKLQSEFFYIKSSDARMVLDRHSQRTAALLRVKNPSTEQVRKVLNKNLNSLQDVILKVGVTPEVQELTKKTVKLTLKVLGANPKLSSILKRMKQNQGGYISNHSLVLAEIACALACKVDWHSSTTFVKLSIAAFLHDLAMTRDDLAEIQNLNDVERNKNFTMTEIQNFKLHPIQAAEFSRQFREVPPDVDTIVVEHHERPDGSGFPRGLFYHQISPLSSLFIIAHDVLTYFFNGNKDASMREFVRSRKEKYSQGTFKAIFKVLQQDYIDDE